MLAELHYQSVIRAYEYIEDYAFAVRTFFFLALVDRQVSDELGFGLRHPESDQFGLPLRDVDAKACGKEFVNIETCWNLELSVCRLELLHSVQTVYSKTFSLNTICYDIPSLCELLYRVWTEYEFFLGCVGILEVCDLDFMALGHGFHDASQVHVAGRNVLH